MPPVRCAIVQDVLSGLNKQFENYLRELAKGKDLAKVRIVLERGDLNRVELR
jgi:hypothetical protein